MLSAFNLGAIDSLDYLEEVAFYAVSALDCLLDYQNYPMLAAEIPAKARRSLGVGVTNFAYWMAKNGQKYSGTAGKKLVHETFEAVQYYLLKASNTLAQHKGACQWFDQTKYSQGLLAATTIEAMTQAPASSSTTAMSSAPLSQQPKVTLDPVRAKGPDTQAEQATLVIPGTATLTTPGTALEGMTLDQVTQAADSATRVDVLCLCLDIADNDGIGGKEGQMLKKIAQALQLSLDQYL